MIWLIGCKGLLGNELSLLFNKHNLQFYSTDSEVDITNLTNLNNYINNKSIKFIINCAAYTAVEKAEDEPEICRLINTLGVSNISICSKYLNAKLLHISTDYVFDGKNNIPYRENDDTNPISIYGITKRDGEIALIKKNTNSYIIRTSWMYGKHGNNFVTTMINLMNKNSQIKVVSDQYGSPTWSYNLANIILNIYKTQIPYGVYHYSNEGYITWYDFAKEIYKYGKEYGIINNNCSIFPCSTNEYPSKVNRPLFSVLDNSKIKTALDISIPAWNESLSEYFKTYFH